MLFLAVKCLYDMFDTSVGDALRKCQILPINAVMHSSSTANQQLVRLHLILIFFISDSLNDKKRVTFYTSQ